MRLWLVDEEGVKIPLIDGKTLRKVFNALCPFDEKGDLRPGDERVTLLAANANTPLELQARAFAMAAADGEGSPMIIQISHTAMRMAGGHPGSFPVPESVVHRHPGAAGARGIALARHLLDTYVDDYGASLVALSLDHFKVPAFGKDVPRADSLEKGMAEARIRDALDVMAPVFGEEAQPSPGVFDSYVNYITSPVYREFRREFLAAVKVARPAWAMIDTELLPPVLTFAVTREIADAVRWELGDYDVMIEAELGATGQSGAGERYVPLRGEDLKAFARQVVAFVRYTGAGGIAYPIGMEHAALAGEAHQPDVERLEMVQREIYRELGRYVPFAQHGGTGAAFVARGLVGKNNVNTAFLVALASSLADHVSENKEGIQKGKKSAAGTGMYLKAAECVRILAVEKLKETGSYGVRPRLEEEVL